MKPKNSAERRKALLKFVAMFLVTMIVVVGAVYFNFKVPQQENSQLRDKVERFEAQAAFQQQFYEESRMIKRKIDSITLDEGLELERRQIVDMINDLNKIIPTEMDPGLREQYKAAAKLMDDLYDNKIKAMESEVYEMQLREANDRLEALRSRG